MKGTVLGNEFVRFCNEMLYLDFADLVSTLAFMLSSYPEATFVMCHQDRNLLYSIDELFEFWGLKSDLIPFSSFEFSPADYIRINEKGLVDDFPSAEDAEDVLIVLEVCRKESKFRFCHRK